MDSQHCWAHVAFDVLLALIEQRDRVVTKNELLDLSLAGLVVEENNLQVQIQRARQTARNTLNRNDPREGAMASRWLKYPAVPL